MDDPPVFLDVIIPTVRFDERTDELLSDLGRELTLHASLVGRVVAVDDQAITDVRGQLLGNGSVSRSDLPSPINGPGINRNRGARGSRATWLVFLDDDVRLPVGWGNALVRLLSSDPPFDLIGGGVGSQRPGNWFSQAAEDFVIRHREYPEGWYLVAAHLLVRRASFEQLDGFSSSLFRGEDWDLCRRAHAMGLRVGVESSITVRHANPTSWRLLALKARQYGPANAELDSTAATSTGDDPIVLGETSPVTGGSLPSASRALRWLRSEYRILRTRGRSRVRATRTLALYVPWMLIYLRAQRQAT